MSKQNKQKGIKAWATLNDDGIVVDIKLDKFMASITAKMYGYTKITQVLITPLPTTGITKKKK